MVCHVYKALRDWWEGTTAHDIAPRPSEPRYAILMMITGDHIHIDDTERAYKASIGMAERMTLLHHSGFRITYCTSVGHAVVWTMEKADG